VSIFASEQQDTAPIPHDPPHTFTYRKLRGREVEEALAAHLKAFVGQRSPRAWAGALRSLLEKGNTSAPEVRAALDDPLLGYDRYVLVKAGLVHWSYGGNGGSAPTPEQIEDLDDESVDLIARAILRHTKPALFQTDAEREAAKKNG
jgi:hypothetical protein